MRYIWQVEYCGRTIYYHYSGAYDMIVPEESFDSIEEAKNCIKYLDFSRLDKAHLIPIKKGAAISHDPLELV